MFLRATSAALPLSDSEPPLWMVAVSEATPSETAVVKVNRPPAMVMLPTSGSSVTLTMNVPPLVAVLARVKTPVVPGARPGTDSSCAGNR